MKIQFDIEEQDSIILVEILEVAAARAINPNSFEALQRVIVEVKGDLANGVEAFQELKNRLAPFCSGGNAIALTSNFRTHLGISSVFIGSSKGMVMVLNQIIARLVSFHKAGATPKQISRDQIGAVTFISELVNLIIDAYEASN